MEEAEFEELIASLEMSLARVIASVERVPADRWDEVIHTGEGAWTCHELLRHMAANDGRQLIRVRIGAGIAEPGDAALHEAELDVHNWNAARVRERDGSEVEALVKEMRANRAALIQLLRGLTPEQRDRPMPFRGTPTPLGEIIPPLNGHFETHAGELIAALQETGEASTRR